VDAQVITTATRPDLAGQAGDALLADWPELVLHDRRAQEEMPRAWRLWPGYDVRILEDDAVAAGGWAVPLHWDGTGDGLPAGGYDGALAQALAGHGDREAPDTLCIMAAAVRPDRQRAGLAGQVISALRDRAAAAGLRRVIAPVRPPLKSRYPLTSMAAFARWTRREDDYHLDPWIRTHQRLGAQILGPAPGSMVVTGTVAQFEEWTETLFPETGSYVVPGALDLVEIDTQADQGTYVETNLWMRHS
jgi:GNAT superfamily N-acetyltransferase